MRDLACLALGIFLGWLLSGCGGSIPSDAGADQIAQPDAGADHDEQPDACAGCWAGRVCVLPLEQTEDRCGPPGGNCGPTLLDCSGTVGSCPPGEQLAARHQCGEPAGQSITRPVCCPANVCTYEACR